MAPVRVELTIRLAHELGVLELLECVVAAPVADDEQLALVHDARLHRRREGGQRRPAQHDLARSGHRRQPDVRAHARGLGPHRRCDARGDPTGVEGEALHATNVSGGLHHAMADAASGFCIYNDPAIAIAWLLEAGAERVAYVDIDVHHGDGVQAAFYDDPRVLTISLHESRRTLLPRHRRRLRERWPRGRGHVGQRRLPPGTADGGWLRAFHAVVPPLLRAFEPDGAGEPARLRLAHGRPARAPDAERRRPARRAPCAARPRPRGVPGALDLDRRRWVRRGRRRPRTWSHLLGVVSGAPVDPADPDPAGLAAVRRGTHRSAGAELDDRRPVAGCTRAGTAGSTPTRGWTAASNRPAAPSSRPTASSSDLSARDRAIARPETDISRGVRG